MKSGWRDAGRPSRKWLDGYSTTWGPYWDVMFPPRMVPAWVDWKRGSAGVNIARQLWEQREYLRRTYESAFGQDPSTWPSRHPGVVLGASPASGSPACLGCQWLGRPHSDPLYDARRHETSDGEYR